MINLVGQVMTHTRRSWTRRMRGRSGDHLYGGGGRNTLLPGGSRFSFILSDKVSHGNLMGEIMMEAWLI